MKTICRKRTFRKVKIKSYFKTATCLITPGRICMKFSKIKNLSHQQRSTDYIQKRLFRNCYLGIFPKYDNVISFPSTVSE